MNQFDSHIEETQFHIEGKVFDGEPFLRIDMPTGGWINLEDAQHIVNMIQAAIDAGQHQLEAETNRNLDS